MSEVNTLFPTYVKFRFEHVDYTLINISLRKNIELLSLGELFYLFNLGHNMNRRL